MNFFFTLEFQIFIVVSQLQDQIKSPTVSIP